MFIWLKWLADWSADKSVAMDVMRSLGRGDWVTVSVVTVVESYTEGPDGAAAGCDGCYPQYFITLKLEQRNNVMMWNELSKTIFTGCGDNKKF